MGINVTVFTPTYNRAYIITQLYESLKKQTNYNFEWLVVDDGSTDQTEELFQKWMMENNGFHIRYYKKENGGKCRAINYALDYARGTMFFIVDSDDYLTEDAIEKIITWESKLPDNNEYCGISANFGTKREETPNTIFESDFYEGTLLDRYRNVDGERAFIFYTEIHRKYKYPEFDNEKFMTEAVVYNRIANAGYKMRFYNDIICIYEYQEDGLTKAGNTLFLNNPKGYGLWLREKADYMKENKLKMYYNFSCEMSKKYKISEIADFMQISPQIVKGMLWIHNIKNRL